MLPYILVASFLFVLSIHFDVKGYTRKKNTYISIAMWVLILFSGLRNQLGIDTYAYSLTYESFPTLIDFFSLEFRFLDFAGQPLWYLFMSLCKTISKEFLLMQMVVAFVFNYLMIRFLKLVTDKVFICLLIFFCTKWFVYNFEILRESICVVLFLNGIVAYSKNRKISKLILYCFPAIFIHWFSIFMFLIFLFTIKVNKRIFNISAIVLSILILVSSKSSFLFINSVIEHLGSSSEKLNSYMMKAYEDEFNIIFYLMLIFVQIVPILILMIYNSQRWNFMNESEKILFRFLPLYLIIVAFTSRLVIAYRLGNYIYPIFLVLAINFLSETFGNMNVFQTSKYKIGRFLSIVFVALFSFSIYWNMKSLLTPSSNNQNRGTLDIRYFPYTSVFQEPYSERSFFYFYWRDWQ